MYFLKENEICFKKSNLIKRKRNDLHKFLLLNSILLVFEIKLNFCVLIKFFLFYFVSLVANNFFY